MSLILEHKGRSVDLSKPWSEMSAEERQILEDRAAVGEKYRRELIRFGYLSEEEGGVSSQIILICHPDLSLPLIRLIPLSTPSLYILRLFSELPLAVDTSLMIPISSVGAPSGSMLAQAFFIGASGHGF